MRKYIWTVVGSPLYAAASPATLDMNFRCSIVLAACIPTAPSDHILPRVRARSGAHSAKRPRRSFRVKAVAAVRREVSVKPLSHLIAAKSRKETGCWICLRVALLASPSGLPRRGHAREREVEGEGYRVELLHGIFLPRRRSLKCILG